MNDPALEFIRQVGRDICVSLGIPLETIEAEWNSLRIPADPIRGYAETDEESERLLHVASALES